MKNFKTTATGIVAAVIGGLVQGHYLTPETGNGLLSLAVLAMGYFAQDQHENPSL